MLAFILSMKQHDEFSSAYNPFQLPKNWQPVWLSYNHQYKNYWIGCIEGLVKYNVSRKTISYRNHNTDNDSIINALSDLQVVMQTYFDKSAKILGCELALSKRFNDNKL